MIEELSNEQSVVSFCVYFFQQSFFEDSFEENWY